MIAVPIQEQYQHDHYPDDNNNSTTVIVAAKFTCLLFVTGRYHGRQLRSQPVWAAKQTEAAGSVALCNSKTLQYIKIPLCASMLLSTQQTVKHK